MHVSGLEAARASIVR